MSDFYYHVTPLIFLPSIAAGGLVPSSVVEEEKVTFIEPDYDGAEIYLTPDCRMLRFPACGHGDTEDGECVVEETIEAELIEVETKPGTWISLRQAIGEFPVPDRRSIDPAYIEAQKGAIARHLAGSVQPAKRSGRKS